MIDSINGFLNISVKSVDASEAEKSNHSDLIIIILFVTKCFRFVAHTKGAIDYAMCLVLCRAPTYLLSFHIQQFLPKKKIELTLLRSKIEIRFAALPHSLY